MSAPLTKTLLLTIALPDFNAEGILEAIEMWGEWGDGDVLEALYEEAGLISMTGRFVNLSGDMEGNDLHSSRAVIVDAQVVDRQSKHDIPEDERLTAMLEQEAQDHDNT